MSKQRLCRMCKQRPPWQYKNCPPGICKRCYHRHIWSERPAAHQPRQAQVPANAQHTLATGDILDLDDVLGFSDMLDLGDDLHGDDEAPVEGPADPQVTPPFLRNYRALHFRIAFQKPVEALQRDLMKNLQHLECTITSKAAETITGYLEYNPRYHTDREATARLHKLLNRWQRKGHLSWSASRRK